ncbi:MAG TPA: hypothetical protein PKD26_02600 [Pyrinomonadaceae bacterium]|nr:hypothetical protein [Pyrinomonadaceae bacterium]
MKNLISGAIFSIVLSLFSIGAEGAEFAGGPNKTKVAVVEFTPGPNASVMTAEDKRQLQASIAFSLFSSKKFDVVDVRNTRAASNGDLAAINGNSTSAAVKLGKQLGVAYVLTGTVAEYNKSGYGHSTLKVRLVEVATGKVKYSGEASGQSSSPMSARAGTAEMMTKVLKPAIEKLTARLTSI